MNSSYKKEDVILLLKDISGMVVPQTTEERERLIQSGRHYSEMIPLEYSPSEEYMKAYTHALKNYSAQTAQAVCSVSEKIINKKGKNVVLVSLARAGTPVGILIKRYIYSRYRITAPHYSISIIRGRGIDKNALNYILNRHRAEDIQFVDGWIGKGAILNELKKDLLEFKGVSPELAVLSDPAGVTDLCGTHEDILIPSSCLNSTVSGLVSRTFLRSDIIGENDFHGAVYYGELKDEDLSESFLKEIENKFSCFDKPHDNYKGKEINGIDEVMDIAGHYGIKDINLIKPGIGETTRVLLRRVPWKILVRSEDMESHELRHIISLAREKNVSVEEYALINYKACGIIKQLNDV